MRKVIYDIGSNNGDDIPYYLLKSDMVVAVEANPVLCENIKSRFPNEILKGELIIENCIITATETADNVSFYIHTENHVLSQFPKPHQNTMCDYTEIFLPAKKITDLINKYGDPYYIKIDIEHYDAEILKALNSHEPLPPFISAESHSIDVFCLLVTMGYTSFKLLEGNTISTRYANRKIRTKLGKDLIYSFPHHSAGPFGNDIDDEWMTPDNFFRLLAFEGLGWKDIHASRIETPNPLIRLSFKEKFLKLAIQRLLNLWFIRVQLGLMRRLKRVTKQTLGNMIWK